MNSTQNSSIATFVAHQNTVYCVKWSPHIPNTFASTSGMFLVRRKQIILLGFFIHFSNYDFCLVCQNPQHWKDWIIEMMYYNLQQKACNRLCCLLHFGANSVVFMFASFIMASAHAKLYRSCFVHEYVSLYWTLSEDVSTGFVKRTQ
jgi:hypothetical protein